MRIEVEESNKEFLLEVGDLVQIVETGEFGMVVKNKESWRDMFLIRFKDGTHWNGVYEGLKDLSSATISNIESGKLKYFSQKKYKLKLVEIVEIEE